MKYYANFSANNSTRYREDITDTNKARLISRICRAANANRFAGNECSWSVFYETGKCVAAGYTIASGKRCRVSESDLYAYDQY